MYTFLTSEKELVEKLYHFIIDNRCKNSSHKSDRFKVKDYTCQFFIGDQPTPAFDFKITRINTNCTSSFFEGEKYILQDMNRNEVTIFCKNVIKKLNKPGKYMHSKVSGKLCEIIEAGE